MAAPAMLVKMLDAPACPPGRIAGYGNAFSLRSAADAELVPGQRMLLGSRLAIALPDGMAGFAIPDRTLSQSTGLRFANSPGLIDNGYRGELAFVCVNCDSEETIRIRRGQPIASLVVLETISLGIDGSSQAFAARFEHAVSEDGGAQMPDKTVAVKLAMSEGGMEPPSYAHATDNGLDLRSAETLDLAPLERRRIGLGFSLEIEDGYIAFVQPRSGLALREGLSIVDSPSIVDPAEAREGLSAVFVNLDPHEAIHIEKGERVAQLVVLDAPRVEMQLVDSLDGTDRGEGGFGSSGR